MAKNEEVFFLDKESKINPYYNQYKSHQFDLLIKENEFKLTLSKYGLCQSYACIRPRLKSICIATASQTSVF